MDSLQGNLFDGKVCNRCGEWKPITKFNTNKQCTGGREPRCRICTTDQDNKRRYEREYYQQHKDKALARSREWALKHHERYKQRLRDYHARDPEKHRQQAREWNKRAIEEQGEAFHEKNRERSRIYRQNNPDKIRARSNNAFARRKRQAEGKWTADEFKTLCDHYGNVCLRCGASKRLHVDHIVPLVKGGRNDITNLQPLCHSCNSRKHTDDTDYRPDGGEFARRLSEVKAA